MKHKSRLI